MRSLGPRLRTPGVAIATPNSCRLLDACHEDTLRLKATPRYHSQWRTVALPAWREFLFAIHDVPTECRGALCEGRRDGRGAGECDPDKALVCFP